MDTAAHGLETNLTEAVTGSVFEISEFSGAGFREKLHGARTSRLIRRLLSISEHAIPLVSTRPAFPHYIS